MLYLFLVFLSDMADEQLRSALPELARLADQIYAAPEPELAAESESLEEDSQEDDTATSTPSNQDTEVESEECPKTAGFFLS